MAASQRGYGGLLPSVWWQGTERVEAQVNGVDVAILVIIGFSAVASMQRGFMLGMIDFLALALAIVTGARLAELLAEPLRERGFPDRLAAGAGFFIASVVAYAAIGLAVRVLLAPLASFGAGTPLGWVNGILGLLPGALRGLAIASLVVIVMASLPTEFGFRPQIDTSQLAVPIAQAGMDALNAGLRWAGIDPASVGLPDRSFDFTRPEPMLSFQVT